MSGDSRYGDFGLKQVPSAGCEYRHGCPGWKECPKEKAPGAECIPIWREALIGAQLEHKVLYLCDQEQCEICSGKAFDQCFHTSQTEHAVNFEKVGAHWYEKKPEAWIVPKGEPPKRVVAVVSSGGKCSAQLDV